MPRLAIGSWAFTFGPFRANPWSLERVLDYAARAGYDGVELNGSRPHAHPDDYDTTTKCGELMRRIIDRGLGVAGYAPPFGTVPPALVTTADYLRVLRTSLAFCERCGIHTMRLDTGGPPESLAAEEYERRLARLAATWHASAQEAERVGMLLVWEFEPGFWLNKPSEVLRLIHAVDHPNLRLLYDTSHAYMGAVVGARHTGRPETLPGGVTEYGRMLAPWIGHLHLIDSDGTLHDNETSTHAPFGTGKVDLAAALDAVRPVIAGLPWWTVDLCFHAEAESAGLAAVPYVRRLMHELR